MSMPLTESMTPDLELQQLLALETRVMNEHIEVNCLCAICTSAWPCERVLLADHAAAYL